MTHQSNISIDFTIDSFCFLRQVFTCYIWLNSTGFNLSAHVYIKLFLNAVMLVSSLSFFFFCLPMKVCHHNILIWACTPIKLAIHHSHASYLTWLSNTIFLTQASDLALSLRSRRNEEGDVSPPPYNICDI